MRVKALFNKDKDLPESWLAEYSSTKDNLFPLEIGKSYLVYAIVKFRSYMWYLVDEDFVSPAPLFSIEDNRISRYWKCYHECDNTKHSDYFLLAFDEWVSEPDFFDSLMEGYEPATSIFG